MADEDELPTKEDAREAQVRTVGVVCVVVGRSIDRSIDPIGGWMDGWMWMDGLVQLVD